MIAALFVDPKGGYADLPGVEVWAEERDARRYPGPHAVVAHPPCSRWCQMASVNEARYGQKIGDDGGCFAAALEAVQRWGGVLEHPALTLAWPKYGLPVPTRGGWMRELFGTGWVTEVSQSAYGHPARKRTWLYAMVPGPPPALDWGEPPARAWVGHGDSDRYPDVPRVTKRAASATPTAFRDVLLEIATA